MNFQVIKVENIYDQRVETPIDVISCEHAHKAFDEAAKKYPNLASYGALLVKLLVPNQSQMESDLEVKPPLEHPESSAASQPLSNSNALRAIKREKSNDSPNKTYLGDGVYVRLDGDRLELTTENGVSVTNIIILEDNVLTELVEFAKKCRIFLI